MKGINFNVFEQVAARDRGEAARDRLLEDSGLAIDLDELVAAIASIEQFWLTFVGLPEHARSG